MTFTPIDFAILLLYFCALIYIGYRYGRSKRDSADFFLGKRSIPWWAVMLSIMATEASALTFIGVPADAFRSDYAYLQFAIGTILARFGIAYLFLPAFYRHNVTTIYEYLQKRFGTGTQDTATLFFFVTRLLASGVRLLGASIAVAVVTGWPLEACIALAALIAIIYTTFGGIKAVVYTDVLQIVIFFGGAVVAMWYLLQQIPGGFAGVREIAAPLQKMRIFDLNVDFNNSRFLVVGIINGFFMTFAALGTDHDLTQRMLTCKNHKESQRAIIWTGFIDVPIVLTFLFIGTLLFGYYQQNPDPNMPENIDHIFPYYIVTALPAGLKGLLIAGVFAAAMSSLDSALGALSSSAVVDVYLPRSRKKLNEAEILKISRYLVVGFGLVLVVVAIICQNFGEILWLGFKIGSFTYGGLLGIFLLGTLTTRGSSRTNRLAMLSSVAVVLLLFLFEKTLGISWPWFVVIGTLWTFAFGFLAGGGIGVTKVGSD